MELIKHIFYLHPLLFPLKTVYIIICFKKSQRTHIYLYLFRLLTFTKQVYARTINASCAYFFFNANCETQWFEQKG